MNLFRILLIFSSLIITGYLNAQSELRIEDLEKLKEKAISENNFKQAEEITAQINNLKDSKPIGNKSEELELLEKEKAAAIAEKDYKKAGEINTRIKKLKENKTPIEIKQEIEILEKEKEDAIAEKDYKKAGEINSKIKNIKQGNSETIKQLEIDSLKNEKEKAVAEKNYKLAAEINSKIKSIIEDKPKINVSENNILTNVDVKISKSEESQKEGIKYRRSSLYKLMLNDPSWPYSKVIQEAFINAPISEKYNNHCLNDVIINANQYSSDPLTNINTYLEKNQVAKKMVAKWFNRTESGVFDMELIKNRGAYNANNIDYNIAQNSSRGLALLSDAGEELIGNTFIVVTEFKYVNKEEIAGNVQNINRGIQLANLGASFIPGGSVFASGLNKAANISTLTTAAVTVVGKGYVVKVTSHLFQLVWNEEIATNFYKNFYMEEGNFDLQKKEEFENSTLFQLQYIGYETALADLQSTIFTNQSEEQLIYRATSKGIDAGISKLQRKFEPFRTKTPLFSVEPLSAKIGLKEGLQDGDKFEVLEQVLNSDGKINYVRKGVIKVDGSRIWNNLNTIEELEAVGASRPQGESFTVFTGGDNFAPGMLIRQIK